MFLIKKPMFREEEKEPIDVEEDVGMEERYEEETEKADKGEKGDGPMGVEPEGKRRRLTSVIESINRTAEKERICLACGNADRTISDCPNDEAKIKVSSAYDVFLAGVRRSSVFISKDKKNTNGQEVKRDANHK